MYSECIVCKVPLKKTLLKKSFHRGMEMVFAIREVDLYECETEGETPFEVFCPQCGLLYKWTL